MKSSGTWITHSEVSPHDLAALYSVLKAEGITAQVIAPREFTQRLQVDGPPLFVIVRAKRPSIEVLEIVRRVADQQAAALVLLDTVAEDREAMLLRSGALDVVRLPLSTQLLGARVLRLHDYLAARVSGSASEFALANLLLRPAYRELWVDDRPLALTKTEYRLLSAFMQDPRRVVSRDELARLGSDGRPLGAHALESHLSRMRSKILAAGGPRLMSPVRGVGYRLVTDPPSGREPSAHALSRSPRDPRSNKTSV